MWQGDPPWLAVDAPLALCVALLLSAGLLTLYSAALDFPGRFELQLRNILIAIGIMWAAANVPPKQLMRWAPIVYAAGVLLLLAVFAAGIHRKGSQRWINVG